MQMDVSKYGMGYFLYQFDKDEMPYVICIGSTLLKLKQSLLGPIDLKAIGLMYTLKKLKYYIMGAPSIMFITDCTGIISMKGKSLASIKNHRLQRLFI